jgi:hypothetical protein
MDLSSIRPAFQAWAGLIRRRDERFCELILSEGQRRYFALRRRVGVWQRWLTERRRLKHIYLLAVNRTHKRELEHCFAAARRVSLRLRVLGRFSLSLCAGMRRTGFIRWLRMTALMRAVEKLSRIALSHSLRSAVFKWSAHARRQRLGQAFVATLAQGYSVALARKTLYALRDAAARAAQKEKRLFAAKQMIERLSGPRYALEKWLSILRKRAALRSTESRVKRAALRCRLFASWGAWRRATAWEQRSRANVYIAQSHFEAELTRRAFSALRVGARMSKAERPVLSTCARVLTAWSLYVAQRRRIRVAARVAARLVSQVVARFTVRSWRRTALVQREARDKLVRAMQHWRRQELKKAFYGWGAFARVAGALAEAQARASALCGEILARRILHVWQLKMQASVRQQRAVGFATSSLLGKALRAWRSKHEADAAHATKFSVAAMRILHLRQRRAVWQWQKSTKKQVLLSAACDDLKGRHRRRALRVIIPLWARAASALTYKRIAIATIRMHREQGSLRRSLRTWQDFASGALHLDAAVAAVKTARLRRRALLVLSAWRRWNSARRQNFAREAAAVFEASSRLSWSTSRRALTAWRERCARNRIIRALATRSRERALRAAAQRAFRALACQAQWRRRRKAAKAAADYSSAVRILASSWVAWRGAHAELQRRCSFERLALRHWEKGVLRRVFSSWKVWQQHRAALAKQWVHGTALRAALPQQSGASSAGAAARPPPRGISGEVAAHLGKLGLLAAVGSSGTGSRFPTADASTSPLRTSISGEVPSYEPLLQLVDAAQRLVRDTAAAARSEFAATSVSGGDKTEKPPHITAAQPPPPPPPPRQGLSQTRLQAPMAYATVQAVSPDARTFRPMPRTLQPDLLGMSGALSAPFAARLAPTHATEKHQPPPPAQVQRASLINESRQGRGQPMHIPPVRSSSILPDQLQDQLQYWQRKAEEATERARAIALCDERIATLRQLFAARLLWSVGASQLGEGASGSNQLASGADDSSEQLHIALVNLQRARDDLATEQAEWTRALSVAQPRLAMAQVVANVSLPHDITSLA